MKLIQMFIKKLEETREQKRYAKLRKEKIHGFKRYCVEKGLDFYLQEVTESPELSLKVNAFIEERARRDLPREQFENGLKLRDLSKWFEIGGILSYQANAGLNELGYSPAGKSEIQIEKKGTNGSVINISTPVPRVLLNDLCKDSDIIAWHSHPIGFGEPSKEDIESAMETSKKLMIKNLSYVIFLPAINSSIWYNLKKVESGYVK